nr:TPA: ATPase F0 subunit 8 [Holtodrilus truncatus]
MPHLSPMPWSMWYMFIWFILITNKLTCMHYTLNMDPSINNFYIKSYMNNNNYWLW